MRKPIVALDLLLVLAVPAQADVTGKARVIDGDMSIRIQS